MALQYPKDNDNKVKERKSFQILLPKFDANFWEFNGRDLNDHGMDYEFEFIENGEYRGYRILSQIKSSESDEVIKYYEDKLSFSKLPVKTATYAISCVSPFVLFVIDLRTNNAYYLPLQDYFIQNQDALNKLSVNKNTLTVYIPLSNIIDTNVSDEALRQIAKSSYCFTPPNTLQKIR